MKIAILGTKGIPNNYGGFEQFAEYVSKGLVKLGHEVTVYNPSFHPFRDTTYEGVKIKRVFSPENYLGGSANFIYDYLCLKDALTQDFDLIYEAGYHSVAPAYLLLRINKKTKPVLVTNMDGIEWRRSKWNSFTRRLIMKLEKIAVSKSHHLISDNLGIQEYYRNQFNKQSFFLPYGTDRATHFDPSHLQQYGLKPSEYYLIIARLEPENNIEMILNGFLLSESKRKICIVGNASSRYGEFLRRKYAHSRVLFSGSNYDKSVLDALRHFSQVYFHGHSVGGTNPSLLEAMGCRCFIFAHANPFNRSVLGDNAFYFSSEHDVSRLIEDEAALRAANAEKFQQANDLRIAAEYAWPKVIQDHARLFEELTSVRRE